MRFDLLLERLDRVGRGALGVQHALWWRWRNALGRTGQFARAEQSDRALALNELWERNWPDAQPIGRLLRVVRSDTWVRFHSLPESKRYADSAEEYEEILRRHRTVLNELRADSTWGSLVVVAVDWDAEDFAGGWSRRMLPDAWPWRAVENESTEGQHYCWVTTDLAEEAIVRLLVAAADDEAHFLVAGQAIDWLYCPTTAAQMCSSPPPSSATPFVNTTLPGSPRIRRGSDPACPLCASSTLVRPRPAHAGGGLPRLSRRLLTPAVVQWVVQ